MLLSRFAGTAVLAAIATLSIVGTANAQEDRDCAHFSTQAEAQRFFESASGDRHRLDADDDSIACEHLPAPSHVPTPPETEMPEPAETGVPEPPVGGIDTGDGSTVDDSAALPLLLGLAGLGAASATAVAVTRRARRSS